MTYQPTQIEAEIKQALAEKLDLCSGANFGMNKSRE